MDLSFGCTCALEKSAQTVSHSASVLSYRTLPADANGIGLLHGGVMMKLMDEAAVVCAMRHCRCVVVTASVDFLEFYDSVQTGELLILKSSINFVGKTSLEVGVRAEAEELCSGTVRHVASGYLTLVAVNEKKQPQTIPPIIPETEAQKRRYQAAEKRREFRRQRKA